MKKYDFGICGAFDFEEKYTGGQSIKTREFYFQLADSVGKNRIRILESTSYKQNPIVFFFKLVRMCLECKNILILPAQNGIQILSPLLVFFKKVTNVRIHYSVIGGWLPDLLKEKRRLAKKLSQFDTILVETTVMKQELDLLGFHNVYILQNFKRLNPVNKSLLQKTELPVRLCYFSRILKEKGIEDAIAVVERINRNGHMCDFDIYGPVIDEYKEQFETLMEGTPDSINYKGVIMPSDSTNVLKKYDLQLFPTRYKTEGIPGSIVDSYFAGVPVVASRWNSYDDIIAEGETGVGFHIHDLDDFYAVLSRIIQDRDSIDRMKIACIDKAKEYMPETVMQQFFEIIRGSES